MILTSRMSKGLNLDAFSYRKTQKQQKIHVSSFSIQKPKGTNMTLPYLGQSTVINDINYAEQSF